MVACSGTTSSTGTGTYTTYTWTNVSVASDSTYRYSIPNGDAVWSTWTTDVTTTTTAAADDGVVWINWNAADTVWVIDNDEDRAARVEAQNRADQERAAARNRARELLLAHLTEKQRKTFTEKGWFIVEGGKTKKQYRIHAGKFAMNIYELQAANDNAPPVCNLCAHVPTHLCPVEDNALAQKLMIETAEDEFRQIAVRRAA